MTREIQTSGPLHATVHVPGSKSITNRALICASLAAGASRIEGASDSDDTALMVNGLNQLGVLVRKSGNDLVVEGKGGSLYAPKFPIPVGNAGTTLRFLLSLASLARGTTVLEGNERMGERPNDDLLAALRVQGIAVRHQEGSSRFEVTGGALAGGFLEIRSGASSQFLSSLLLVAPYARQAMTVAGTGGLASPMYLGLTLDVARHFGAGIEQPGPAEFKVDNTRHYAPADLAVETDASGASYPLAAAAIAGGEVFVPGVREESRQGDSAFGQILRAMGCAVTARNNGLSVRGGTLHGITRDMNGTPDLVPTLAAVALFADGATTMTNIAQVRHKESNRLEGLAEELRRLGADVRVNGDGMEIHPAPLHGAVLDPHDDHRLAMAFALIGLRVPGVSIENPDCVRKSFPGFWNEFERMYGR
jgi:3-phosphoshikimate 1-carboxyvinyltransferase